MFNINNILFISFITFIAYVPGYTEEVPDVTNNQVSEIHTSEDGRYSIEFPSDWEIIKDFMGTDVVALAPIVDSEDLFRENANVIFTKLESPISRDDYYSFNLDSLKNLLSDFDLEKSEDVSLNGVDAKKIVFTHTMGVVNAKVMQFLILNDRYAYVITMTADPLDFDRNLSDFEKIGNSFKLVN